MSILKFINSPNDNRHFIEDMAQYITDPVKTKEGSLVSSRGCMKSTAVSNMIAVKKAYHKTSGKQGEHFVLSLTPEKNLTDALCQKIAKQVADYYKSYQSLHAVHKDSAHTHIHFILNSVSYLDGHKFSQSRKDLNEFKVFCNKILHQNNLDIIKLSCRDMTQYISNAECDDFRFLEVQEESDFQKEDNLYQTIQDFDLPDFSIALPTMPYAVPYCNMQQPKEEYIMDQKNLFDRNQGTQSSYANFTTVSSTPVCDARNDSTSIISSNKTAVEANPIQQAYNSTYPNFEINLSRNLQISVDETADFNRLCPLMENFNGISPKEKVDYTKLGMAVVSEFSDKGIHANVSVNLSTTVSIDLCNSNMNAEQIDPKENVIDVPWEE